MNKLLSVLLGITLLVSLFSFGLFPCLFPPTTTLFSELTSNDKASYYDHSELVTLAGKTRNFSVNRPAGGNFEQSQNELCESIANTLNTLRQKRQSLPDSTSLALEKSEYLLSKTMKRAGIEYVNTESIVTLANADDLYGLDHAALSHLIDCNKVFNCAIPPVLICMALSVLLIFVMKKRPFTKTAPRKSSKEDKSLQNTSEKTSEDTSEKDKSLSLLSQRKALGRTLIISPLILISILVFIGIWAAIDFFGLFSFFHSIFFPQGNWTFSANSLLISMYPTEFWMSMGGLWLLSSLTLSIACIIGGRKLIKTCKNQ